MRRRGWKGERSKGGGRKEERKIGRGKEGVLRSFPGRPLEAGGDGVSPGNVLTTSGTAKLVVVRRPSRVVVLFVEFREQVLVPDATLHPSLFRLIPNRC